MFAQPSFRDNVSSQLFFEGLHNVSMKHSSIVLLIRRMQCLANEMEVKICEFHDTAVISTAPPQHFGFVVMEYHILITNTLHCNFSFEDDSS
jgi:hypothetical protein